MSIRQFNYGRNRRGRVSVGAERFLYSALFLSILLQIILDRKSTRLNSSHSQQSRMPSSA